MNDAAPDDPRNAPSTTIRLSAGVLDAVLSSADEGADPGPAEVQAHRYAAGERLAGLPPDWAPGLRDLGVTTLQLDLPHLTTPEVAEGRWDWSLIDRLADRTRALGFRVRLFPHWHWPPPWYLRTRPFTGSRCLEHDMWLGCFSVWDPELLPWSDRCIAAMCDHFRNGGGLPDEIAIGVHGDYGECMFPTSDTATIAARAVAEGGAPIAHCHVGFWCGDRHARADFARAMLSRHGTLDRVNRAWGSDHRVPGQLAFPRRDASRPRAWLDFTHWYRGGMTAIAARLAALYRRHLPGADLAILLGGGVEPIAFGQDNSGLPGAMQPSGTQVRSTASCCLSFNRAYGRIEKFTRCYAILKRVSTSCRFHGVPLGLEPPYPPSRDATGVTAGIFEVLACGAAGYNDWAWTYRRRHERYRRLAQLSRVVSGRPIVDTAVLFPESDQLLAPYEADYWHNLPRRFWDGCSRLRHRCDYDVVDETLVRHGALDRYRRLILFAPQVMAHDTVAALGRWLTAGGTACWSVGPDARTVDGDRRVWREMAGLLADASPASSDQRPCGDLAAPHLPEQAVPRCGYDRIGPDATSLLRRGDVHVAWQCRHGAGRIDAMIDAPRCADFFHHLLRRSDAPPAPPAATDPARAGAVFATRFENGWAILNLNDQAVSVNVQGRNVDVPGVEVVFAEVGQAALGGRGSR